MTDFSGAIEAVVKHPQGLYWAVIGLSIASAAHTWIPDAHSDSVTQMQFQGTVKKLNNTVSNLNCLLQKAQLRDLRRERANIELKEMKTVRDRRDLIELQADIQDAQKVRDQTCTNSVLRFMGVGRQ